MAQRGTQGWGSGGDRPVPGIDTAAANPARVWNYWVGGTDNFAADREIGRQVLELLPFMPMIARFGRRFLIDAVGQLSADYGIRQFLDIGTGLPTANNTHEVAQAVAPESRIVYVDNDPAVLAHARVLLTSSPEGKTGYIAADLREPGTILAGAEDLLDFRQPVAVLLIAVLHFLSDLDDPYRIVAELMDAVPPGSYLAIVHAASDILGGGRGKHGPVQQDVLDTDDYADPGAGGPLLRRAGPDRARASAAGRMVARGSGTGQGPRHAGRIRRYHPQALTNPGRRLQAPGRRSTR